MKVEMRYNNRRSSAITTTLTQALANLVSNAKGNCVSLTSRRLIKLAGAPISHPLAKYVLNALADRGFIIRYNVKKGKYILCSDSQLWKYLKADDRSSVASIIDSIMSTI